MSRDLEWGEANSSFSRATPRLQLGVDSTSLGEFKLCPRRYQLGLLEGYQKESAHLSFGMWLHQAREGYDRARAEGASHDDALDRVVDVALRATWDETLGKPWASPIPEKSRSSLIRTIVWYLDELGEADPIETLTLADGAPAVELSFRFDSGYRTQGGEPWVLCGHLDRIGRLAGKNYIVDIKTTKNALIPRFFEGFSPDNQFTLYSIAGEVALGRPVAGLIVDACQVGVGFTRFQRGLVARTAGQLEEWMAALGYWLRQMEGCAQAGHWPMNDKACGLYGGCHFRQVCASRESERKRLLDAAFKRRTWDPLRAREREE